MSGEYWRGYRGGPERTAAVESSEGVSQLTERWTVGLRDGTILPDTLRTTPHGLLVGRSDGLSVLNAETGTQRWNYTQSAPTDGLAYAEGRVYFCDGDDVVALDSQSGAEVDTLPIDIASTSDTPDEIAVRETTLIANTRDGIAAYDTTSGDELWTTDGRAANGFAVGDDRVYGIFGDEIRAFVLNSGRKLWTAQYSVHDDAFTGLRGARPEGIVGFQFYTQTGSSHGGVTLLSGDTGAELVGLDETMPATFHVVDDAALVAHDGTIERRKLSDESVVWGHSLTGSTKALGNHTPMVRAGETLYVGTGRQVTALNTETGAEVSRLQLSHPLEAVAPTGDQLFVAGGQSVTAYEDQVTKVFDA